MTIDSENLGNGSAKPERFTGKYRGGRREGGLVEAVPPVDELGARDDGPGLQAVEASGSLAALDLGDVPVYQPAEWSGPSNESLVEHPLLRGLIMELPPKGSGPAPEWLDRWFEAARAILELLYVQGASRSR